MTGRHRRRRDRNPFGRAVADTAVTGMFTIVITTVTGLVVARVLGSSGRGTFAAITSYSLAAAAICECGLTTSVCYHVAHRRDIAAHVLRTGVSALLLCGVLTGLAGFFLTPLILHNHPEGVTALRVAFAAEPIVFLAGAWLSTLQAVNIRSWNVVRLSQSVCYMGLVLVVSAYGRLDVLGITLVFIGSSALQCLLAWSRRRRQIARGGEFRWDLLRPMLRYGLANATSRTPYLLNTRLDQLVMAVALTPGELGNYAVAVTLSLVATPVTTAFGSVALPRIAANHKQGKVIGQGVLTRAVLGSLAIGLLASVAVCAVAPAVVPWLLGPSYGEVVTLLWVLAPGAVLYGTNKVMGDVLCGFDRSTTVAWAEGVALAATVGLLFPLLPVIGTLGAAVASTAAYALAFVFLLRALLRHTGMPIGLASARLRHACAAALRRAHPDRRAVVVSARQPT